MSFIDLSLIAERERRMEQIMVRLSSLPESELNRISQMLQAQSQINNAVQSAGAAVSGGALVRHIENTLAGPAQTITSNLTQLLGFVPSSSDMTELLSLQTQFGSNFSSAIASISSTINTIEGGISQLLQAIDTGVTQGIQAVTTAAQNAITQAQQQAVNAIQDALPSADSIIPQSTLDALSGVVSDINSIISVPAELANQLTSALQNQLNENITQINSALDGVSRSIQSEISGFINSVVSASQFEELQTITASVLSTPLGPPLPQSEFGESYDSVPLQPNSDLNSAPITYGPFSTE